MDLDKLALIGDVLLKAGEKDLADYVASMMLGDSSEEEDYIPPVKKKSVKDKKIADAPQGSKSAIRTIGV